MLPLICISAGDPAGIGPEIVAKSLSAPQIYEACRPVVVAANGVMEMGIRHAGLKSKTHTILDVADAQIDPSIINVISIGEFDVAALRLGEVSGIYGDLAVRALKEGLRLVQTGKCHALASAPLNKEAMHLAGYDYAGQTEMLADLCGVSEVTTMVITKGIHVLQLTTHVSLLNALKYVKKDRILRMIQLSDRTLKSFGYSSPRIGVAAINPHAGEGGKFGFEEIDEIEPAVAAAWDQGIRAVGPIPADTIFVRAEAGEFDVLVSMYHDQCNILLKYLGAGITVVAGLPLIRTSVNHGTAFDIAGKGIAKPEAMKKSIEMAARLALRKLRAGQQQS